MLHSKALNLAKYTTIEDVEMRAFNGTDALSASIEAMKYLTNKEQNLSKLIADQSISKIHLVIIDTQYNSHQYSHTILVTYGYAAELSEAD